MQGRNFAPMVGGGSLQWREDFYHEFTWAAEGRIAPSEGIRSAQWKYIRYPSQNPVVEQLFNLQNDPSETKDLIADPSHSLLLNAMRAKLDAYRISLSVGN
jgi:arylsulfatase A-like enzyme